MDELQKRMPITPNVFDFTQVWRQTVLEFVEEKSSALKLAKMLIIAEAVVPRRKETIKSWAEKLTGKKLGSAMANGYKAYTVAKHIVCWKGGPTHYQIDEKTFDALGIVDCLRAAPIINEAFFLDQQYEIFARLCDIFRQKNDVGAVEKKLIALLKEVRSLRLPA